MIRIALTAAAALFVAAPALAQTALNATFEGTAITNILNPIPSQQTFTLNGGFLTYAASSNLPQIAGGDLNFYLFSVSGLSSAFDEATRTMTYSNVTGLIFYDLNQNGVFDDGSYPFVQGLAPTTLTATFDPTFTTAALLGSLVSSGPTTPVGFPGPVDFTPANGALIVGTYLSNGPQSGTVTGSITFAAVPEPATWAMMVGGVGLLGAAARRRPIGTRSLA